jgi:hypothetical protein
MTIGVALKVIGIPALSWVFGRGGTVAVASSSAFRLAILLGARRIE